MSNLEYVTFMAMLSMILSAVGFLIGGVLSTSPEVSEQLKGAKVLKFSKICFVIFLIFVHILWLCF